MKKLAYFLIVFGVLCFIGIIIISAKSHELPRNITTIGYIALGYIGVISFTFGWLTKDDKKK